MIIEMLGHVFPKQKAFIFTATLGTMKASQVVVRNEDV